MRRKVPSGARRAIWGAADQGVYSVTNLALTLLVASVASRETFGAFSAVFIAFTLTLGISQALASEVFNVVYSTSGTRAARAPLRMGAGCVFGLGIVGSVVALGVSALTGGLIASLLPAFAAILPALFLQDFWRFSLFAMHRPKAAFMNDVVWAVFQAAAFISMKLLGQPTVSELVLGWGAGAVAAAAVGAFQLGVIPRPLQAWTWLHTHRQLGLRFAGEWIVLYGAAQIVLSLVGAVAGLAELASLRAALVLFGPLQTLLNGVRLSVTGIAVRVYERGTGLGRFGFWLGTGLAAVATAWCVAVFVISGRLGPVLLGDSWHGAAELLLPLSVQQIAAAVSLGALTVLRATRAARRSFRVRATLGALVLALGSAGAVLNGAFGTALGLAVSTMIGAGLLVVQAKAVLSEPRPESVVEPEELEFLEP